MQHKGWAETRWQCIWWNESHCLRGLQDFQEATIIRFTTRFSKPPETSSAARLQSIPFGLHGKSCSDTAVWALSVLCC